MKYKSYVWGGSQPRTSWRCRSMDPGDLLELTRTRRWRPSLLRCIRRPSRCRSRMRHLPGRTPTLMHPRSKKLTSPNIGKAGKQKGRIVGLDNYAKTQKMMDIPSCPGSTSSAAAVDDQIAQMEAQLETERAEAHAREAAIQVQLEQQRQQIAGFKAFMTRFMAGQYGGGDSNNDQDSDTNLP